MIGILLSPTTGDLDLSTGRLALGDVRAQTAHLLITSMPGEIREYPLLGLGVATSLGGEADPGWAMRCKHQLRHCGLHPSRVQVDGEQIIIDFEQ